MGFLTQQSEDNVDFQTLYFAEKALHQSEKALHSVEKEKNRILTLQNLEFERKITTLEIDRDFSNKLVLEKLYLAQNTEKKLLESSLKIHSLEGELKEELQRKIATLEIDRDFSNKLVLEKLYLAQNAEKKLLESSLKIHHLEGELKDLKHNYKQLLSFIEENQMKHE